MSRPSRVRTATTDLLQAFDLTLQQGTYEPSTLAPIARLFSAGDVVLQSNLAYWRYNTPRPQETWALFNPPPAGIGKPVDVRQSRAGHRAGTVQPHDEEALAEPANAPWPPPIAVFPVSDPRPIYRAEPATAPLVIDGSGAGVVAAAAAGLLDDNPTIFYAGTLDGNTKLLREVVTPGAQLVLTDSNRKVLERWSSVSDNIGETLPGGARALHAGPDVGRSAALRPCPPRRGKASPSTARPVTWRLLPTATRSPSRPRTGRRRPSTGTSRRPGASPPSPTPTGNWLQVRLDHPVTTDHLNLVQVLGSTVNRWITRATVEFDGSHAVSESLTPRPGRAARPDDPVPASAPSRPFGSRSTARLGRAAQSMLGASGVGFSEVRIPGVQHRRDDPDAFGPACGRWGAPRSRTASPS